MTIADRAVKLASVEYGATKVAGEQKTVYHAKIPGFGASGLQFLKVLDRQDVVGFLSVHPYDDNTEAIDKIWVHPDFRRAGIATKLLAAAQQNHKLVTPILTNDGSKFFAKRPAQR